MSSASASPPSRAPDRRRRSSHPTPAAAVGFSRRLRSIGCYALLGLACVLLLPLWLVAFAFTLPLRAARKIAGEKEEPW